MLLFNHFLLQFSSRLPMGIDGLKKSYETGYDFEKSTLYLSIILSERKRNGFFLAKNEYGVQIVQGFV